MKYDVAVAIPTFNAEPWIRPLLNSLFAQKTSKKYEVLIIDSGSSDSTVKIIQSYPKVRLHHIPNREFGHGRTRNLAAQLAKGKYILYLTQDAIPAHEAWLEAMIEPFSLDEKIALVVGKQIPLPNAPVTIKREVASVFKGMGSNDHISLTQKKGQTLDGVNTFNSNTNSAVRRSVLLKIPFRDVNYAEDQGLAIDLLNKGYIKAYAPLGSVNHSHNYGIHEYFKRKFDEYVGLRKTTGYTAKAGKKELFVGSIRATVADWIFIVHDQDYSFLQKIYNFWRAPFYNFVLRLAIRAAAHEKISEGMHDKLSLEAKARQKGK